MVARRSPALFIPFMAVLLTFATAAAPAAHAVHASLKVPSAGCPAAEIIGVHGTGEGPSPTGNKVSPEIKATFAAFVADEQKLSEHGAYLEYYPYPALSFTDYLPTGWPKVELTVNDYAAELEAELESFSSACPHTPISLVGYSLGALLIDNMLSSYDTEWNHIDAVELYGDPCWYNPRGGYRGLAQYAAAAGIRLGCFPPNAYRDPLALTGFHFAAQSLCISRDPVCGQGWPPYEIGGQVLAAALCLFDRCPHLSYSGASAGDGAKFLAEHSFRQTGGDG